MPKSTNPSVWLASGLALGLLGLSGCAPLGMAHLLDNPSLKSFQAKDHALKDLLWWQDYNDDQLNGLMLKAFYNSPDLAMAEARLYKAEALYAKSKALNLPNLSLYATSQSLSPSDTGPDLDRVGLVGLNFKYELDFWGKNQASIRASSAQSEAADAETHQAMLILSTSLASAYFDLSRLYELQDLSQALVINKTQQLKLIEQKLSQGLSARSELEWAKSSLLSAKGEALAQGEAIELAKLRLALLAGQDPAFAESLRRPNLPFELSHKLPERIDLNLIGRRPDVVAARWRAEGAAQSIRKAEASFYPNINLMAFTGMVTLEPLLSKSLRPGNIGPALTLPLFDGDKLNQELQAAQGDHAGALAAYKGAILNAMHDVADVVTSRRALDERLDLSQASVEAASEAYRLGKLRYEGGLSDYATLLAQEQTLISQKRQLSELKTRAALLDVALIKATGGPF